MKSILIALCLCVSVSTEAQSNAFWSGIRGSFSFKGYSNPVYNATPSNVLGNSNGSISANNGELIFYSDFDGLYSGDNLKLPYSDTILRNPLWVPVDYLFRISQHKFGYINIYDTFDMPVSNNYSPPGLYFTELDSRLNAGKGGLNLNKCNVLLKQLNKEGNFMSSAIVRADTSSFLLFSQVNDTLWAFTIDEGGVRLVDSLAVNVTNLIPFPISEFDEQIIFTDIAVASTAEDIYLLKRISLNKKYNIGSQIVKREGYRSYVMDRIGFDPSTNSFTGLKTQLKLDEWVLDTGKTTERKYIEPMLNNSISENDSFIYLAVKTDTINSLSNKGRTISYDVLQISICENPMKVEEIIKPDYKGNVGIKETPNGKMLVHEQYREVVTNKSMSTFHEILDPNVPAAQLQIVKNKYVNEVSGSLFSFFSNHVKDHIRLKHTIEYMCEATVQFTNFSNSFMEIDKFTWYITNEQGLFDTIVANSPTMTFSKSGDYFYKVYAQSAKGSGYGEMWYDTLKIRIPEKPVAAFTAADTVICAYVPLEFTTQSTTDNIHTTNGEKWVWTFGDGETQTVLLPFGEDQGGDTSVSHVYTTPGTYTVSLFYSNGFCDSTLTKNQYIKVVDAPAPGFSIDNNRGCSPFTVNVTDTVTKNTTKKEYLVSGQLAFTDSLPFSGNWDEYYSLPFGEGRGGAFTFSQAGTYWITQRLYGYTGCITQLDSQRVFVTSGFTEFDTSQITNATYQDVPAHPKVDEVITINWPCLLEDAYVRYDLYKNNQKIAELDSQPCVYGQMWYADSLEQASTSIVTYTVVAIDSCGTATQVGRVGQPVYVSGEVVGNNEFSIIRYTAYQDWNVGESELSYELQTEDLLGGWMTINEQTSATPYNDYEFLGGVTQSGVEGSTSLSMTSLEKCYRVVAKAGPSKSSISTIVCLPYTPVVFIPTAFSPNGDNLNDVYRPVTFGIEHYEVDIYNSYGQKVIHFTENEAGWVAEGIAMGAYMVIIRAKGTDNEWYNLKSTVTVVR